MDPKQQEAYLKAIEEAEEAREKWEAAKTKVELLEMEFGLVKHPTVRIVGVPDNYRETVQVGLGRLDWVNHVDLR